MDNKRHMLTHDFFLAQRRKDAERKFFQIVTLRVFASLRET